MINVLFNGFLTKLKNYCFTGNSRVILISMVVFWAYFLCPITNRRFWTDPPWYDEVSYVSAAQSYLRGDFSVNFEHPVMVKVFLPCL